MLEVLIGVWKLKRFDEVIRRLSVGGAEVIGNSE